MVRPHHFLITFLVLLSVVYASGNADGLKNETEINTNEETTCRTTEAHSNSTISNDVQNGIRMDAARKAWDWLLAERDERRGWKDETHMAIVALALSDHQRLLYGGVEHLESTLKQLDLQLALALAKQNIDFLSQGQLALYIDALLSVCRNPRDFYGINLVSRLYHRQDAHISQYEFAFVALTLCNAGVRLRKSQLMQLVDMLPDSNTNATRSGEHDHEILAVLALQCVTQKIHFSYLKRYVDRSLGKLKHLQNVQNGGFGNIYTTAIVAQAFSEAEEFERNKDAALSFLLSHQRGDGSIGGDLLATYFALPPISGHTFVSISRLSCNTTSRAIFETEERDSNVTIFVAVTLSLWSPQSNLSKIVFAHLNSSLYDVISQRQSGYRFDIKEYSWGHYIKSINEVEQNVEEKMYWFIYKYNSTDNTITASENGIDDTYIEDKDHYVFFYKTMN